MAKTVSYSNTTLHDRANARPDARGDRFAGSERTGAPSAYVGGIPGDRAIGSCLQKPKAGFQ